MPSYRCDETIPCRILASLQHIVSEKEHYFNVGSSTFSLERINGDPNNYRPSDTEWEDIFKKIKVFLADLKEHGFDLSDLIADVHSVAQYRMNLAILWSEHSNIRQISQQFSVAHATDVYLFPEIFKLYVDQADKGEQFCVLFTKTITSAEMLRR